MHIFCRILIALSLCLQSAGASPWSVSSDVFARLVWVSSLKIGDYLYLDGGYYDTEENGVYTAINILNETLSIDLSQSWNISDVEISSFSKPSQYYGTRTGAFWWDSISRTALAYGGEFYNSVTKLSTFYLWELEPDGAGGGVWSARTSSDNPNWGQAIPAAYASIAQSNTTGYALGGFLNYASGVYPLVPGLMAYEFQEKLWTNITSDGGFYSDGLVAHGAAHFVLNVGEAGLILFIGGLVDIAGAATQAPSSNITIYDPAAGKWYQQQASGTPLPINRLDPCLIGVQESGSGSYEIYMWGGRGGGLTDFSATVADSDDVYILTLPAFHWIKANAETTTYRSGPTCQVVGNQLVSVGGVDPSQSRTKDSWRYGIGILDMTELRWKSGFNHTAPAYARPDLVNNFYKTNPAAPSWNSDAVQVAFAALDGSPASTASQPTSSATGITVETIGASSETPGKDSNSVSSTNVGAIVGGVVGGVAVLIVLIVSWFILKRRRQRRVQEAQFAPLKTTSPPQPTPIMVNSMVEVDSTVKGPHNGRWELSG